MTPDAPSVPAPAQRAPEFAVIMTVKNGRRWIEGALGSILPQLGEDGELVVVDAVSTDGTTEYLRELSKTSRLRLLVEPCSMGVGRDRGIHATKAPIVLTQVDADVRYAPQALRRSVEALHDRPRFGLLLTTGARDPDPDGTKVFAWRREFYLSTEGYPDTNVGDDVAAVRGALRKGKVGRLLLERVGDDLRASERPAGVVRDPWKKGPGFLRLSRRRFTQGWTWSVYVRFLWVTRRTVPRFLAGAVLAFVARLSPAR
jgi:glycosyltransferase involved in cell wall biosynthesis